MAYAPWAIFSGDEQGQTVQDVQPREEERDLSSPDPADAPTGHRQHTPESQTSLIATSGTRLFISLAVVPPLLAAIAAATMDAEPDRAGDFYSTCAQVIGTVFLALAGLLGFLRPRFDASREETVNFVRAFAGGLILSTVFGLTVTLYALASVSSSPFLGVGAAATIAIQVLLAVLFSLASSFPEAVSRSKPSGQTDEASHTRSNDPP